MHPPYDEGEVLVVVRLTSDCVNGQSRRVELFADKPLHQRAMSCSAKHNDLVTASGGSVHATNPFRVANLWRVHNWVFTPMLSSNLSFTCPAGLLRRTPVASIWARQYS